MVGTIRREIGWKIDKMTGIGTVRGIARVNGAMMKVPIWCVWSRRLEPKFESAEQ